MASVAREAGGLALVIVGLTATPGYGADEETAWRLLVEVREHLVQAGPQQIDFEQTYVPAGFVSGETESGTVALDLPDCLRWDYQDPYPKSYLLCHARLHTWNPGEPIGHVFVVDEEDQAGLDLLRLAVPDLRRRYEATVGPTPGAASELIRMSPRRPEDAVLVDVEIELSPDRTGLAGISYTDAEGNRTAFRFTLARAADDPEQLFGLPEGIEWQQEGPTGGLPD